MTGTETDAAAPAGKTARSLLARTTAALEKELARPLAPGLYLVSTPIGNLADISLRALSVLARADMVFAEDTRHTRKLFSHFGITRDLEAYHEHNAAKERPRIVARIRAGHAVALVADAGTPLVSDPGHKLVRAVLEDGLTVLSVPGPSAAITALISTGLPSDRFFFEGFLPPKRAGRRKRLAALADIPATLVLFEARSRLVAMLEDAAGVLGAREAAVAKELTKIHEAVLRGPLTELAAQAAQGFSEKGEFVAVIAPAAPAEVSDADITAELGTALDAGQSLRDAARNIAEALGVNRTRVYQLGLALKEGRG